MRAIRFPIWCLVVLSVMVNGGCESSSGGKATLKLSRGRPFEPDIPVPADFAMIEESSEDRSTGTARLYLRHVYLGTADKYAVRNFYREQMPLARWTKVSDGNVKGHLTMRFEKNNESCSLTITSDRKALSTHTRIQVVIAREERGDKPPNPRTES